MKNAKKAGKWIANAVSLTLLLLILVATLALFTAPEYGYISSSIVRDVLRHGGPLGGLVPPDIEPVLRRAQPRG